MISCCSRQRGYSFLFYSFCTWCIHRPTLTHCDKSMSLSPSQNEQTRQTRGSHCVKILFLFYPFEPEAFLNVKESVFTLFLFSGALALNRGGHCQMGKRLHRHKERAESIRKWQLFSCARGAWATSWSCCQGDWKLSQLVAWAAVAFDRGMAEDVGWNISKERRCECGMSPWA